MTKNEILYYNMMKNATKKLKELENDSARVKIEMLVNHKSSYKAFDWQVKLVNEMKIYITYLGLLDYLIQYELDEMHRFDKFNDVDAYRKHSKNYENYKTERYELVKKIETKTGIVKNMEVVKEVIKCIPASNKFNLLYEDAKVNQYQLSLQHEFINAYNTGIINGGYISYDYATKNLKRSEEIIEVNKEKNKVKVAQIKLELAANE